MKRRYLLAWPLILAPFAGVLWAEFIKRIVPHLSQNEMAFVGALGFVAIIFFSMTGTSLLWLLTTYLEGREKITE